MPFWSDWYVSAERSNAFTHCSHLSWWKLPFPFHCIISDFKMCIKKLLIYFLGALGVFWFPPPGGSAGVNWAMEPNLSQDVETCRACCHKSHLRVTWEGKTVQRHVAEAAVLSLFHVLFHCVTTRVQGKDSYYTFSVAKRLLQPCSNPIYVPK